MRWQNWPKPPSSSAVAARAGGPVGVIERRDAVGSRVVRQNKLCKAR